MITEEAMFIYDRCSWSQSVIFIYIYKTYPFLCIPAYNMCVNTHIYIVYMYINIYIIFSISLQNAIYIPFILIHTSPNTFYSRTMEIANEVV